MVFHLPGLRLSPPGVKVGRGQRPYLLGYYSFNTIDTNTLPLAPLTAMQYSYYLDLHLQEIVYTDPTLVPVYVLKVDVRYSIYHIRLRLINAPKLFFFFPTSE